jgi:PAS domain S-box-containing protein
VFVSPGITEALGYAPGDLHDVDFVRSVMHPDDWPLFLDYLGRLARLRDQETAEFEYRMRHGRDSWHWFRSRDRVFTRNEEGSVKEIVGTAADITERKTADEKARFIADLNQALLPLSEPDKIMQTVVRMVGEYLDVDRCGYAEVDKDHDQFIVMGDYVRGEASSIVGCYQMSDFGDREKQVLQGNRPYIVNDIEAETPPAFYHLGRAVDGFVNDALVFLGDLQAEGHVLEDGHVRIECIVLENHRYASVLRFQIVDHLSSNLDRSTGDVFESRNHS